MNMSPVANSVNAQNHLGVQPGGGDVDNGGRARGKDRDRNGGGNVEFNDVNSTLDVSGGSTAASEKPVNQAPTASGGY